MIAPYGFWGLMLHLLPVVVALIIVVWLWAALILGQREDQREDMRRRHETRARFLGDRDR